jgi:uncharacterized coiled-coil protein SlyX
MGESGLPVREILDLPFAALVYRVKVLEEKLVDQANQITTLASQIANNRTEMALKEAKEVEEGITTRLQIPKDLMPTIGKYRARKNRSYEIVKKRWALWKVQFESGLSQNQIAKAWGCDHASISYARRRNFEPRKTKGRPLVEFPVSERSAILSKKRMGLI